MGEWREEYADAEGQGVQSEQAVEAAEEGALAPGPDGTLRQRSEHGAPQAARTVDLTAELQPGEIVLPEPASQSVPIEDDAEQRRDGPGGSRPGPSHLASNPAEVAITPSSRVSTVPAGRNLSNLNSTLTASP